MRFPSSRWFLMMRGLLEVEGSQELEGRRFSKGIGSYMLEVSRRQEEQGFQDVCGARSFPGNMMFPGGKRQLESKGFLGDIVPRRQKVKSRRFLGDMMFPGDKKQRRGGIQEIYDISRRWKIQNRRFPGDRQFRIGGFQEIESLEYEVPRRYDVPRRYKIKRRRFPGEKRNKGSRIQKVESRCLGNIVHWRQKVQNIQEICRRDMMLPGVAGRKLKVSTFSENIWNKKIF